MLQQMQSTFVFAAAEQQALHFGINQTLTTGSQQLDSLELSGERKLRPEKNCGPPSEDARAAKSKAGREFQINTSKKDLLTHLLEL
jgi:hypothetical protein